jgi:hypothetical protein
VPDPGSGLRQAVCLGETMAMVTPSPPRPLSEASSALTSATDHGELTAPPAELEEMARTGDAWPEADQLIPAGEQ